MHTHTAALERASESKWSTLILVVDDQARGRQALASLLEPEGYRVHFAVSGAEALRQVQLLAPDLVLLDVMMPEMDGYGENALISLADNGRTLSPEQLTQIWEPYHQIDLELTGQIPGLGLGMAIVSRVVLGAGGTCRVVNQALGPGIVVELSIPFENAIPKA